MDNDVTVTVNLNDAQAWAFAEFLKRVGLSDYKGLSVNTEEAYSMLHAGEQIRKALAEAGYAPR
jgi:hypothetical protein